MIDLLSRKLATMANTNVSSVLSANGAGVVGTAQGQSVQQALDQIMGGNVGSPVARTLSTALSVGSGQQLSGAGAAMTGVGGTVAAMSGNGTRICDVALIGGQVADQSTTVIGVDAHNTARGELRNVSVDLSASNGQHRPAFNLTGTLSDHLSFNLRGNTAGYGYLTNNAPTDTSVMDGHVLMGFNITAQADAIEYNNPGAPLKHNVTWGGILNAGAGGSGNISGFALGIAHNQGWVAGGFVSRFSRREAVHIEDGCSFGVLTGIALRGCQANGIWAAMDGYGSNQAQATPIVISNFSAEGPGAANSSDSGVFLAYTANGYCERWPLSSGYVSGFQTGLWLDGKGVKPATWVTVDACTNVLKLNTQGNHRGTLFSSGAPTLLWTNGAGSNIADRFVQSDVGATSIISATGSTRPLKDAVRGFDMPAIGSLSALPNGQTFIRLFQAPKRMRGRLTVLIPSYVLWHCEVSCDDGLTLAPLGPPLLDAPSSIAISATVIGSGTAISAAASPSIITVSSPSGTIAPGQLVSTGLAAGTRIVRQISGTTGGAGNYLVDVPQSLAAGTQFTGTSPLRFNNGYVELAIFNAGTAISAGTVSIRVEFDGIFYA